MGVEKEFYGNLNGMDIEEQFNVIAEEYDRDRRIFIPCFEDFYNGATEFIAANIVAPRRVLDLGAGTGLLSHIWFKHFPNAEYVLADIADDMLKVARRRFSGLNNFSFLNCDYSKEFPGLDFDCIISALSIHHLEDNEKRDLFARIYGSLPSGGVFVNYDQFCASNATVDGWINSYWEKRLSVSGLSEKALSLWQERRLLDRECSVPDEIGFIKGAGFETVQCVYSNGKFAVIVAIK